MNQLPLLVGLGLFVLLLIALVAWWRHRTRCKRELTHLLTSLAPRRMRDLFLPDGLDGQVWIDQLLCTPHGILILDIHHYPGHIFGGENIDQWTRILGGRSLSFPNPLLDLAARVQSVRALADDVPVIGRIVFTSLGEFPKGIPQGVSLSGTLVDDLVALGFNHSVPAHKLNAAWERLEELATPADSGASLV